MALVEIDNFPPIHRIKFMQGSGSSPGRCVLDCGNDSELGINRLPRVSKLKIQTDDFQGTWDKMRIVKAPRARNGSVRVVMEDSRWMLEEYKIKQNYNERDSLGAVMTGNEKTVSQLLEIIKEATGGEFNVRAGTVPDFKPPARWADKTCAYAIKDLMKWTGCRLVYIPEEGVYQLTQAGEGGLPDFGNEIFQPAPPSKIKKLKVRSYPTLHERKMSARAVYIDQSTGDPVNVAAGTALPASPTETNGQGRYRLWKVDDDQGKLLVEHRAKSHLCDPERPTMERGRVIRDAWQPFPYHQDFVHPSGEIVDAIETTSGGKVFVTRDPVMSSSGGNISVLADVLTGYYEQEDGGDLVRLESVQEIDSQASEELVVHVDWIRPIDSDQSDVGTPEWEALLESVGEAMAKKLKPPTSAATVSLPGPIQLGGSGQVGEVEYDIRLAEIRSHFNFRIAVNFEPGSEGEVR